MWVPVLHYLGVFADPICHKTHTFQQQFFLFPVALYPVAHSVVCYSVHQATTDLYWKYATATVLGLICKMSYTKKCLYMSVNVFTVK